MGQPLTGASESSLEVVDSTSVVDSYSWEDSTSYHGIFDTTNEEAQFSNTLTSSTSTPTSHNDLILTTMHQQDSSFTAAQQANTDIDDAEFMHFFGGSIFSRILLVLSIIIPGIAILSMIVVLRVLYVEKSTFSASDGDTVEASDSDDEDFVFQDEECFDSRIGTLPHVPEETGVDYGWDDSI